MTSRSLGMALLLWSAVALAVPEGPEYPSPEWTQRELSNYAKVSEAPLEQASNPVFMQRLTEQGLANFQSYVERSVADPSWNLSQALNTPLTPLCTTWSLQCTGDPFRYPGVDPFYETEAEVASFVYYDQDCARISGRVWKPLRAEPGLPAVIIENGSVQAPEPLYWWAAQLLVRNGYVVMTFDPRGQGRSDQQSPTAEQGSNINPSVFWEGLVNAIDFFRSNPVQPYPHNETCAGTYPTEVTAFNPFHETDDPDRLGLAGHSLGGRGVSVVQGYGGVGADPYPGLLDSENPVDVIVAWDGLSDPNAGGAGGAAGNVPGLSDLTGTFTGGDEPVFVPRVPAMGHSSEYGLTPAPFLQAPDPEGHKGAFASWQAAAVPAYQLTIQGSSHYEWSLIPTFPTTSWCPEVVDGQCADGWGLPLAEHYTLAWFDRWLKQPGEVGYDTADARLTADEQWADRMSFYYRSARDFPARNGQALQCDDIRGAVVDGSSCGAAATVTGSGSAGNSLSSNRSGGGCTLVVEPGAKDPVLALLVLLAILGIARHRFKPHKH
ncbi:MAG: alpha/beta hydrolase family protein [Nevskiales bacterium]